LRLITSNLLKEVIKSKVVAEKSDFLSLLNLTICGH